MTHYKFSLTQLFICTEALSFLLLPNYGNTQTNTPANNNIESFYSYNYNSIPFNSNVRLNEINTSAFRHFINNYPSISNEQWFRTAKGFTVIFKNDSILTKIFYTKKGAFICSLKYYDGQKLNNGLKNLVQINYPGYKIKTVTEEYNGTLTSYELCIIDLKRTIIFDCYNNQIINRREFSND